MRRGTANGRVEDGPSDSSSRPRGRPLFADAKTTQQFQAIAKRCRIKRNSNIPLWVQLKASIEEAIYSGALKEGARLPSEQIISEVFGVSRPVTRNALAALSAEGLVIKQARRGMFVAAHHPEVGFLTEARGVFEDLSAKGHKVRLKTFSFAVHAADDTERRILGLPEGQDVIRLLRGFWVDDEPLHYAVISLPEHRLPGMRGLGFKDQPLFDFINKHYGLRPQRADRWIKGTIATAEVAWRMGIPEGTPMLSIESVTFDFDGKVLEYARGFYNADVAPVHIATDAGTFKNATVKAS